MKCIKCKKETKNVFYPASKEARYAKCDNCLRISMNSFDDVYEAICSQKLYYKKTDGGAEYLCKEPVKDTTCGDIKTAIVRLDGGAELI